MWKDPSTSANATLSDGKWSILMDTFGYVGFEFATSLDADNKARCASGGLSGYIGVVILVIGFVKKAV